MSGGHSIIFSDAFLNKMFYVNKLILYITFYQAVTKLNVLVYFDLEGQMQLMIKDNIYWSC